MRESYNNICTVEFYTFLPLSIGRTHLYFKFVLGHKMNLSKTLTTAILAVTAVIAASTFMSTQMHKLLQSRKGFSY